MKKIFAILFWMVTAPRILLAQLPQVTIPGSEIRTIRSTIVSGQEYELQILLPSNYGKGDKKYPVVYLMDSQWDFPLLKSLYGQHYFDGFIPEMIIVGVTWGGSDPNPDSLRARDYTPTHEARYPQSGGADKFLAFMKEELFPFVEKNYHADAGNRVLMGCSLGGLFTLYTLFTQPGLFTGYAAASPAVGWDKEVLYRFEKTFSEKKLATPVRVYMTVGDVERGKPTFEKIATTMADRNYPSVFLQSKVLENTGHSGTKTETYGRGLQFIFERPKVDMDITVLDKYVGGYHSNTNTQIDIKREGKNLVVYFSSNNKYTLYAATENSFYANSEFLDIKFDFSKQKEIGLQLEKYGSTQYFTRNIP